MKKNDVPKDELDVRLENVKKPYVQFSKKIIFVLLSNLIIIEAFFMYMVYKTEDTSILPYLITGIAATIITGVIWYLKNSEAEKKCRIDAEIERMKFQGIIPKEAFDDKLSNEIIEDSESVDTDIPNENIDGDAVG